LINCETERKDMSSLKYLASFLKKNEVILDEEIKEFELSKIVRNCFIHNAGKVRTDLLHKYFKIRNVQYSRNVGDPLFFEYSEYEKWYEMTLNIAERLIKIIPQ